MTAELTRIRMLVASIDLLRTQHRAGHTPPFGQVEEMFDIAAQVRDELPALETRLAVPPPSSSSTTRDARLQLESLDGVVKLSLDVPLSRIARAVMAEMHRVDAGTVARV